MIKILNDLKEYCKDCPYMVLTHCETLGSGRLAYTCKYKRICERLCDQINSKSGNWIERFGSDDNE